MRVLVTGGNGFLGLNVVEALTKSGHEVMCLVRHNSNTEYLDKFPVDKIIGTLCDKSLLKDAIKQVDAVIHTAGVTGCKKSDLPELIKTNANSTKNICDICLESNVKRLVYTSTTSTIGCSNSKVNRSTETTKLRGFRERNPYGISKLIAESHIKSAIKDGLEAVILNPAEVVGPYDYNYQWGRIVLAVESNQLPFVPPGGGSFCHARAVGEAHVNALTLGKSGERYILAGSDISFIEYINKIEIMLGKRSDVPKGSYWVKYLKALLKEHHPSLVKDTPAIEAYRMRVFGGHYYFDSSKAVNELNYREEVLDEMLDDCISWYQSAGIISGKAA